MSGSKNSWRGILDFIAYDLTGSEVDKKIRETFKVAEDNEVELEKYYKPLTVSLQKAIKRMELQSKIDGKDRNEYINAFEKLIGAYEPTPTPAPSSEK